MHQVLHHNIFSSTLSDFWKKLGTKNCKSRKPFDFIYLKKDRNGEKIKIAILNTQVLSNIIVFVLFIFLFMTQNPWNLTCVELEEVRHTHYIIIIIIIVIIIIIISLQQSPSR